MMGKSLIEKAICNLRERLREHVARHHLMTARGREITNSYEISLRFDQVNALFRYIKKLEKLNLEGGQHIKKLEESNLGEWQIVPAGRKVRKGDMVFVQSRYWELADAAIGDRTGCETSGPSGVQVWKTKRMVKKGRR